MRNRTENLSRERDAYRPSRDTMDVKAGVLREVQRPKMNPKWHPIAKMLWTAGHTSGMADFYQNTDIALLYSICDDISTLKIAQGKYGKINANAMATAYAALGGLGFSEGERRRMRIELSKPEIESEDAQERAVEEYRKMLHIVS